MSAIVTQDLTKQYNGRGGIQGLDLRVEPGSVYGFLGPNGAGKTTTLRVLMGFMKAQGGAAQVLGKDAWREGPAIRAETGYIPGDLRLYPWMNLTNGLAILGRARGRDLTKTGHALAERFQLPHEVLCRRMSRGMRQKLGLILSLAHEPKVLILDEPTTALDPPMQEALYDHLRDRARDGAAVFFSSHTLAEVETLCERVAILRESRLVADESIESLRRRAHRVVHIDWQDEASAAGIEPPEGLTIESREGARWTCLYDGPAKPLIDWASAQAVADIDISPPDLDRVFRSYYAAETAQ